MMLASALASLAGTLESGRAYTLNVACNGGSEAKRTSIGPEREAIACGFGPKPKQAEPSVRVRCWYLASS